MAIYHLSVQIIKRSGGRSAVAAAAYRAGERLEDERTGLTHDYTKRHDIESEIMAPEHAPEWVQDRERLWNEVEKAEIRIDAQVAREINLALPIELNLDEQRDLLKGYIQDQFVSRGMVADVAIHRDNPKNPHAHIMLTMREITEDGFGKKKRDWNSKEFYGECREGWENHANKVLERAGIQERIDHRSFEEQGITDRLPQIHEGVHARAMEARGIQTERGDHNRMVQEHNAIVRELAAYREEKERSQHMSPTEKSDVSNAAKLLKSYVDLPKIEERFEQLKRWETQIQNNRNYLDWKSDTFEKAAAHWIQIDTSMGRIQKYQEQIDNISWINPFKLKENRQIKEGLEKQIAYEQRQIQDSEKQLNYSKEKLGYITKEEFYEKYTAFREERAAQYDKNRAQESQIRSERQLLNKAKEALQNAEIRRVVEQYPDWKAAQYLDYDTAHTIQTANTRAGRIIPIESLEAEYKRVTKLENSLREGMQSIEKESNRLELAENALKDYETAVKRVQELDSPLNKGKRLFSDSLKQEYAKAVEFADLKREQLKTYGITERADFDRQKQAFQATAAQKPQLQKDLSDLTSRNGFNLLNQIMKGVEHATRQADYERMKAQYQQAGRGHQRQREREQEYER